MENLASKIDRPGPETGFFLDSLGCKPHPLASVMVPFKLLIFMLFLKVLYRLGEIFGPG